MSILESDIKLLQSERNNDSAEGGGFMTGLVIPDGVENNLFPDVSEADRTLGRVQIRKVYLAVTSADSDTYLGAHVLVDSPASDPAVTTVMVARTGYAQMRADLMDALANSGYRIATVDTPRYSSPFSVSAGSNSAGTVAPGAQGDYAVGRASWS